MTDGGEAALEVDTDRIERIASSLDLRRPNREALESIVWTTWHHFASGRAAPFEGVVDSATGVGKTYIMAAALDYLAGDGVRNFAVICPGRTILNKTVELNQKILDVQIALNAALQEQSTLVQTISYLEKEVADLKLMLDFIE